MFIKKHIYEVKPIISFTLYSIIFPRENKLLLPGIFIVTRKNYDAKNAFLRIQLAVAASESEALAWSDWKLDEWLKIYKPQCNVFRFNRRRSAYTYEILDNLHILETNSKGSNHYTLQVTYYYYYYYYSMALSCVN